MNEQIAQTTLPDGAQEHVNSLPEHLRPDVAEQLGRLSHVGLQTDDTEHRPERAPMHQDVVTKHLHAASELLARAHNQLKSSIKYAGTLREITHGMLTEQAIEIALNDAWTAKQRTESAGLSEAAIESVESSLVLNALMPASALPGKPKGVDLVQEFLKLNLSDEAIMAAHNTFGLVANPAENPTPVNAPVVQRQALFRTISTFELSDDGSKLQDTKKFGDAHTLEKLGVRLDVGLSEAMLAYSLLEDRKAMLTRHGDTADSGVREAQAQLVAAALGNLEQHLDSMAQGDTVATKHLSDLLGIASNMKLEVPLEHALTIIRDRRDAGMPREQRQAIMPKMLDQVLINLIRSNKIDIAAGCMTASSREPTNIDALVNSLAPLDFGRKEDLRASLTNAHHRRQETVQKALGASLSDQEITTYLAHFHNPDSLAHIPPTDWAVLTAQDLTAYPPDARPIDVAQKLMAMHKVGIPLDFKKVYESCPEDQRARDEYLESAAVALQTLATYREKYNLADDDTFRAIADQVLGRSSIPAKSVEGVLAGWNTYQTTSGRTEAWALMAIAQSAYPNIVGRQISKCVANDWETNEILALCAAYEKHGFAIGELAKNYDRLRTVLGQLPEPIARNIALTPEELFELASKELNDTEVESSLIERSLQTELTNVYGALWQIDSEQASYSDILKLSKQTAQLAALPRLRSLLASMGIDGALAESAFSAWATNSELMRTYNIKQDLADQQKLRRAVSLNAEEIQAAITKQAEHMAKQARAMVQFANRYGAEELQTIGKIFNIRNFGRYSADALHNQLEAWESGEVPVRIVSVSAWADHNGAFATLQKDIKDAFCEQGLDEDELAKQGIFFFEANDAYELAQITHRVGIRERQAGRDPLADGNGIEAMVISAHGNPRGIDLGVNGEALTVEMYATAMRNLAKLPRGSRPNDYSRDLGNHFEIILNACSTAKELKGLEANLASAMAIVHKKTTQGASDDTQAGHIRRLPDGSFVYRKFVGYSARPMDDPALEMPAVTYGTEHRQARRTA